VSYRYGLNSNIDLHVKGRIAKEDARRQTITAKVILQRLEQRPGLILADEVGMGKTFIALAVAASVALQERQRRPVVVMVPPSLKEKWPKDFEVFKERCIKSEAVKWRLTAASADNAVQFLKLLDDAPATRVSIIFLTHGAMSPYRKLQDRWVKLAIIQKALYRRRDVKKVRRALCRFMGELLRMKKWVRQSDEVWEKLLKKHPSRWLEILKAYNMPPPDNDDPVPEAVIEAMEQMEFSDLYATLKEQIPYRDSPHIERRLKVAREGINKHIVDLWDHCIRSLKIKLPLLVLDEAHHLKNAHTQLASLFHSEAAAADAAELERGPLAEVFERMLFLTATPFQLGHHELCSVLERFGGISWKGRRKPSIGRNQFFRDLKSIRQRLDSVQEAAVRLDHQWGHLQNNDLKIDGETVESVDNWWQELKTADSLTPNADLVVDRFRITQKHMRAAEVALQPYLIRHARLKTLPDSIEAQPRRVRYAGCAIKDHNTGEYSPGLDIESQSILPFLLATRVTALKPHSRPVFAEGLASSYEAFLHTREQRQIAKVERASRYVSDLDDDAKMTLEDDSAVKWYLDQLQSCLNNCGGKGDNYHPKIAATVARTLALWKAGEKVLVFCHYLATGDALQSAINEALDNEINQMAAVKLGCSPEEAGVELEKIGRWFFKEDSPIRRGTNRAVRAILNDYPDLADHSEQILRTVRRYLRTPSFLTRYFPLESERLTEDVVFEALRRSDASGMSLEQLLKDFFSFLVDHCGVNERNRYMEELENIQTGSNVRLANGKTKQEIRQRLMLTFNTPLYQTVSH